MNCCKSLSIGIVLYFGLFLFMGCNKSSKTSESDHNTGLKTVNVGGIADFTYSDSLNINPDIPFELLVDKEYKKHLPDSFNYDLYKPDVLLVSKYLDLKDTVAMASFPNIILNLENPDSNSLIYLNDELKGRILEFILRSIDKTTYKVSEWKNVDTFLTKDSVNGLLVSYRQINADNKSLNVDNTYLFPHGKMIRITLTSPDSNYGSWKGCYNDIVNSVVFTK